METFFDIATKAELADILGTERMPGEKNPFDYERALLAKDKDYGLILLASLYANRGDIEKADSYVEAIADPQRKLDTMLLLHECQVE